MSYVVRLLLEFYEIIGVVHFSRTYCALRAMDKKNCCQFLPHLLRKFLLSHTNMQLTLILVKNDKLLAMNSTT